MEKPLNYNFLTVGPASWDTNIVTGLNSLSKLTEVLDIPDKILEQPGGAAVNMASGLINFLSSIAICGVTGNDVNGNLVQNGIAHMGIDTSYLRKDLAKTVRSISAVTRDGEKHIFYDGSDLNNYKYPDEVFRDAIVKTSWAYFSIARFSRSLLPIARQMNTKIATDVQAIENFSYKYEDYLRNTDVLFASGAKLKLPIAEFIKQVWRYGPQIVLVTQGELGVTLGLKSIEKIQHYKVIPTKQVIDTTGAGDSFAAAFCGCLSQELTIEESLLKALIFSSNKVQYQGSLNRLTSYNELHDLYLHLLNGSQKESWRL